MSINSFLNQSISLKLIIVVGGFWALLAAFGVLYFFGGVKEGFQAGLVGIGTALDYKMGNRVKSSWENKDVTAITYNIQSPNSAPQQPTAILDVNNDTIDTNVFADLETNEGGDVPLPEGELVFFDKTKFSPECCPSSYSTGEGCVCASPEQMQYLNQRGGNRTLTSVY